MLWFCIEFFLGVAIIVGGISLIGLGLKWLKYIVAELQPPTEEERKERERRKLLKELAK